MSLGQSRGGNELDERLAALVTNANAVRAITSAVDGTIGPKGLDTMLVDRFGEVIITNDGVTILDKMDVNHPAAKMLINIAKAQQEKVGDGTTTATIMAGSLVVDGVNQVIRGVPVARVIEGMKYGINKALECIEKKARKIKTVNDAVLNDIAMIAGREHSDIAQLVVEAAKLVGAEKLKEESFKFSDIITAETGAENEVFLGVIANQERMSKEMPEAVKKAKILLVDDALEPEEIEDEALSTEIGFRRYIDLQDQFKENIQKIVDLGVNVIMTDRGIHSLAEEILADFDILAIQRVGSKDMRRVADHTGAKMLKRSGLKKESSDIEKYLGYADKVYEDEKLEHVRILGGKGKPMATILVGASTDEVVGERERIAKDAAASVQAAIKSGFVPGGGSVEVYLAREISRYRDDLKGMSAYGLDSVIAALKQPLARIVENSGFNPLEKVEDVVMAQSEQKKDSLAVDCDTGEVCDMLEKGIVDPLLVKRYAIKAAGEVAVAILRIDTIIKKKDDSGNKQDNLNKEQDVLDF
ncbi:TCP-1/cpn60 chaperonin family protein [Selenomonadales bacterium OttesenSCG-928-I06]|nr:TCP-1/cpn60 chaperonin family protein [Selenomonadales bacterium OttesenSCG-928-I06]